MKKPVEKKRQLNRRANRQYKNNLFVYLFTRKKEYALSLYNAVNNTDYTNEEDLEFKLLENVLFVSMINDVSFIFDSAMNLYEHQSTLSRNMPLRGLFYFADLCRKLIPMDALYQKKVVRIPVPKYIVFYNGPEADMQTEREEIRLSEAFQVPDKTGGFEWTATVLNINFGYNTKLFDNCAMLKEYTQFVEKIKRKEKRMDRTSAMREAIQECLEEGILVDFLKEYGEEIVSREWYEIDQEMIDEIQYQEALEDARVEGRALGLAEGRAEGRTEGRAEGRAEAEHTIFLLKKENEELRKQLALQG